jgi:hypothetical protein
MKLFSLEFPQTTSGFQKLTVEPIFYTLTGRPMNLAPTITPPQEVSLTLSQIEETLKRKEGLYQRQRALSALKQMMATPIDINDNISDQLYDIIITEQNINLRVQASELLPSATFFNIVRRADQKSLDHFIETETNEKLLQQFIHLIQGGADIDKTKRSDGTRLLLQFLRRNRWLAPANLPPDDDELEIEVELEEPRSRISRFSGEVKTSGGRSIAVPPESGNTLKTTLYTLSEAIVAAVVSALARIANDDVLVQVVESLDPRRDIPSILLPPLKELEAKSRYSVISLFMTHRFTSISEATLQSLRKGRSYSQLMDLWDLVMGRKREPFARQVLSSVLQQKIVFSTSESGENKVINWLNDTIWDDIDQEIIAHAIEGSPDISIILERVVPKDMKVRVSAPSLRSAQ